MNTINIFQGLSEVAGQAYNSTRGLRENGFNVELMIWNANPSGYPYDYSFNIKKSEFYKFPFWIFKILCKEIKILKDFQILHFHFGRSLFLNHDLWLLKKTGKKIFFEFHGSDLRDYKIAKKLNPYVQFDESVLKHDFRKRTKKILKYADGIILHDAELLKFLPEKYSNIFIVPLRVDLQRFKPVYDNKEKTRVTVVHAPTYRAGKGSQDVIHVVNQLMKIYPIDFILVENKTQTEAIEIYSKADIIIDQICAGTYGVFAIEGMALGKPVITYITDEMKASFPDELPIVSANKDTLREALVSLIESKETRFSLGMRGRQYVETYHDYRINGKLLGEIYKGNIEANCDKTVFSLVKEFR